MPKILVDLSKDKSFVRKCNDFVRRFKGSQISNVDVNQRLNYLNDLNSSFELLKTYISSVQNAVMKAHGVDVTGIRTYYPPKYRKCKKIYNRGIN